MKRVAGVLLAGAAAVLLAADEPAGDIPMIVPDKGASSWVVDRFAGNSTAGPEFFQGPARQAGGLGRCSAVAPMPDGRVFLASREGILEVTPDGMLHLAVGGGGDLAEGPVHRTCGGESLAYNPRDKCLYFTGPTSTRRATPTGRPRPQPSPGRTAW